MPGAYLYGWDYTNKKFVECLVTTDGKLIINPAGFLENPPTEDEDKKAPTSEWAFDHWKNVSAHHVKYTDTQSRSAIGNLLSSTGALLKNLLCGYFSISRLQQFKLKWSGASLYELTFKSTTTGPILRITGTKSGEGYKPAYIDIYDSSAYKRVIDAGTFQSYLDDYLENPPTEDVADKAPTSEWAFDHDADAAAHHAKYTHGEAVGAFYARKLDLSTGIYTDQTASNISYILLDTSSGDITLKGLADGAYGQLIFCVKVSNANNVHIIHASGDAAAGDKIYCVSAGNESIAAGNYGCFWLVHQGGIWLVDHTLV